MEEPKNIFTIMPFAVANDRDESALSEFFSTNLKKPIEKNDTLHHSYRVTRSGNEFNMLSNIVTNLREADIVLADLSGRGAPNPNVMYELAIRFSVSRKPVILFREDDTENRVVFDIGQLHCFRYKLTHLRELQEYIIDRLKTYEISPTEYQSPVLQILGGEFSSTREAQRNEVSLSIQSSMASLHVLQRQLAGAIHEFLSEQDVEFDPKAPDGLNEFRDWFSKEVDKTPMKDLNWDNFYFHFQQLPALSNLLVDSRFQDYLPESVKREVNTKLLEFFIEYFGSSKGPYKTSIRVHNIFADLHNTMALLGAVGTFIGEDNKDKKLTIYDIIVGLIKK